MPDTPRVRVIGGGLAGPEAALQAARLGCDVTLYEMRPTRNTPAHQTSDFAELVCSNSLKSESENTAPWLLKQEMRRAGSFLLAAADASAVPAGHALAVDREHFSRLVAEQLALHPRITIVREEITSLDEHSTVPTILATGPLTSPALTAELQRLTGSDHLAFYDSISPIVDASTIDMDKVYLAARWDKGTADYINCPFTKEEYDTFLDALIAAEKLPAKEWELIPSLDTEKDGATEPGAPRLDSETWVSTSPQTCHPERSGEAAQSKDLPGAPRPDSETWVSTSPQTCHPERSGEAAQSKDLHLNPATAPTEKLNYFEGCLPIEEIARRGRDTLRFGPMKPAGLTNPKTGRWPYAVVQLRQENLRADSYNLVGFQNHLKFSAQARVLRLIPGLEKATFLRYGQIHRNTYLNSPTLLTETLQLKAHPNLLIAGQLSGVEGYTESIAAGMLAGRFAAVLAHHRQPTPAPRITAHGSLIHYITHATGSDGSSKRFQPANITFDLLLPLEEELRKKIRDKKERHKIQCDRALAAWNHWLAAN